MEKWIEKDFQFLFRKFKTNGSHIGNLDKKVQECFFKNGAINRKKLFSIQVTTLLKDYKNADNLSQLSNVTICLSCITFFLYIAMALQIVQSLFLVLMIYKFKLCLHAFLIELLKI